MKRQKNVVRIEEMTEEQITMMMMMIYSQSNCSSSFGEKKERRRRRISGIHRLTLVLFAKEDQLDVVAVGERMMMKKKKKW